MKRKSGKYRGMMQVGGSTPVEMRMQGKQNPFNWMSTNTQCPEGYYFSVPDNQCRRIVSNTPAPAPVTSIIGENPAWTNYPPLPKAAPTTTAEAPLWHNTPEDIDPQTGETFNERLPGSHPDNPKTGEYKGDYGSVQTTTTKAPHNWNTDVYLGLRGTQVAASYLAGKRRDSLMNEYDYKQQSALGQMNPMPISQFQYGPNDYTTPNRLYAKQGGIMNPYSYHAKYGGNLKTIMKDYNKWSNDAGPMDMTQGTEDPTMQRGGSMDSYQQAKDLYFKYLQQKGRRLPTDFSAKQAEQAHQYMLKNMKYNESSGKWSSLPLKDAAFQFGNTVRGWWNDLFGTNLQNGGYLKNRFINTGPAVPSLQLQLRNPNTVIAVPGGSTIPGDSTRYMPGLANQFGIPYTIDQIGVKGNAQINPLEFLDVDPRKMRVYQDSVLGKVNGFRRKKGGFALDEMVVNDFVRKLMQFGRGPHPYKEYGRRFGEGGRFMGINPAHEEGGNWIPKNLKKGRCTPAPNPDCPVGSPQYNLAQTFKKHHGFHEEEKLGGLTANKAREILHDGTAQGHPLTDKQRRFFGAMSKGHTNYRGK